MPNNWTFQLPPRVSAAIAWGKDLVFPWICRRIIAVDLGAGYLKIAVADEYGGQLRLVRHQIIDLQAEGLLTQEEIDRQLQEIIQSLGNHPLAVCVSQHLALSHIVDLPAAHEKEIAHMIEHETRGLSGLSDSAIVFDYRRLHAFGHHVNPFWVTIAREEAVQGLIQRLAGPENNRLFREASSTANALITTYLNAPISSQKVVLVDLGASTTTVVVVYQGQGVLASTLQVGSESFTQSIAALKQCPFEEAEHLKKNADLFDGPDRLSGFSATVELWRQDVEKVIREWEEENPASRGLSGSWTILVTGGGSLQPGLMIYIRSRSRWLYETWQGTEPPLNRHTSTYGLLLLASRTQASGQSLLPSFLRLLKRRQQQLLWVNQAGAALVLLLMFFLATGFSWKLTAVTRKETQLANIRVATTNAMETARLLQDKERAFKKTEFLVTHQTQTADALASLRILQKIRENRDLWFLLFADHESYLQGGTLPAPETNTLPAIPRPAPLATNTIPTNLPPGYIVEFSLPDKTEDRFKMQREVVNDFKSEQLFKNVDQLPPTQRSTNFFDPKQLPLDRYYSLALDLEEKPWQRLAFEFPRAATNAATNTVSAPKK